MIGLGVAAIALHAWASPLPDRTGHALFAEALALGLAKLPPDRGAPRLRPGYAWLPEG